MATDVVEVAVGEYVEAAGFRYGTKGLEVSRSSFSQYPLSPGCPRTRKKFFLKA